MATLTHPPEPDQLAAILQKLNLGPPISMTALEGGSNASYRIDLATHESVVLKLYSDFISGAQQREAYASALLSGLNVPITRYFMVDQTRTLLPQPFTITNYLHGATVGSFRHAPDIADLHRQMGRLLRLLHTVRLPAFGHFDQNGIINPETNHLAYIRGLMARAFVQFRHYGADPALAERLEAIVDDRNALFAQGTGAVFAHDDLNPNNVLAERDASGRLRLTGLIDFGNARAADPVFDLAKTLFICEHEAPGSSAALLAGYGPVDHPQPEAALWIYTLIHRVVMWWWLRHVGIIPDHAASDLETDLRAMADAGPV